MPKNLIKYNDAGFITHESDNVQLFNIKFNEILAVGEYTNSDGPFADDWYLVLICSNKMWYPISMYSDGIEEFKDWLSKKLDTPIEVGLANNVKEKSRIIYPDKLKGRQFVYQEKLLPKSFWENIQMSLGLKPKSILRLHQDIEMLLK